MASPAIFLDRDGVLNANRDDHVKCWEEFQFLPGALAAMRMLTGLGLPLVVVTNQAIVNRGIVSRQTVEAIHARMHRSIARAGGRVDRILYCPHTVEEKCGCRKPESGLLEQAASELELDLARSVFVGDALTDIEAGERAGCRTVLVRTGRGNAAVAGLTQTSTCRPDAIASDLFAAISTVSELLGLTESPAPALEVWQQERAHAEFTRLQVATHLSDAAFGS